MRRKFRLLPLFCILAVAACAQEKQPSSLNIGDSAPPLQVRKWVKGTPIRSLERGKMYVVDFWATWCRPCNASMPHLLSLAHRYKYKVIFLVISIWENGQNYHPLVSTKKITSFVDSMGNQMDFPVAIDDSNFMAYHWMQASDQNSIPSDFVINRQGKIAWIGNPVDLDTVLPKIVDNTWDIKAASLKRAFNEHLEKLDYEVGGRMQKYLGTHDSLGAYLETPDSALLVINKIVEKEPKLKYAPITALFTFWALLVYIPNQADQRFL